MLDRFNRMRVHDHVSGGVARNIETAKPVKVKWIRTNTGSEDKPEVGCRLVAQELLYGERLDELLWL